MQRHVTQKTRKRCKVSHRGSRPKDAKRCRLTVATCRCRFGQQSGSARSVQRRERGAFREVYLVPVILDRAFQCVGR